MRPSFPTPQGLQSVRHPSKFPARRERIRGTIQVKLSFQIDGFGTDLSQLKVILNKWTKRNNRSFKWLPKTSFIGRLPIRQQICDVSQIGVTFHGICPPTLSFRPDCNNTAEVPSFSLRTALSAIPLVSDRCGVDVQWFHERSSQAFPNSKNCQCKWLLVSSRAPGTFASFSGFLVKFCFLHGYAWIHWVARSRTTTAYRWLFRDSQLSLRTLWSAVIKSPNFSARGTCSKLRLLYGACVILVRLQISQFRFLGKWVWTLCLPKSSRLFAIGSKEASWEELAWEPSCNGISSSTKFSLNSCSHSGISGSSHGFLRSIVVSFWLGFGILLAWVSTGFPWSMIQSSPIKDNYFNEWFSQPIVSNPEISSCSDTNLVDVSNICLRLRSVVFVMDWQLFN